MIEQFLETALEFSKEIWFQLNSRFDLENTEAYKFLKPYLAQLQDDPLYMGIALAALFLVPYGMIKIRSVSKEREQKLDELMEEMEEEEEEYDEDDPRRLRKPESSGEVDDEDTAKPLFGNDESFTPSEEGVLDDDEEIITEDELEAEFDDFELEPSDSSSDKEETSDPETNIEPVSSLLTESEFDKDMNDFMAEELDWEKDATSEPSRDDSSHDQAIKELQEEGELMELEENLPTTDPFANYSELNDDEQDKAIKDLQDEMERTINQLTQQIEEPSEVPSTIKDLSQIHIGGDATIDEDFSSDDEAEEFFLEDSSPPDAEILETQSEAPILTVNLPDTPITELSDEEILASLEPELETSDSETETIEIPDTHDYQAETSGFTFEPESDISPNDVINEPELTSGNFSFETEPIEPEDTSKVYEERPSMPVEPEAKHSSPENTDSLIDRLKFLQTRFENRYQPIEPIASPTFREKKVQDFTSENIEEPRRYTKAPASVPPDSKKYMDLLESFIFMKDQKKHK